MNDGLAARYTKTESDGLYVSKTVFDVTNKAGNDGLAARYTKTESDGRYPTLTTYNTDKTNTNDGLSARYTKTESDGRYPALATYASAIKIANDGLAARYTKTESDGLYVSKPVFDAANKVGNDGLAARYTKTEVDTKVTSLVNNNTLTDLKPKTMWCADGDLCQVPTGKKGFTNGVITIDGQTIKNDKTAGTTGRLYLSGSEKLYVLNKEGVVIGKESGANGNLSVQGTGDIAGIRLSNGWTGYPDAIRDGVWKSEISNDVGEHKSLMIAGNKSSGGARKIRMVDDVSVNGELTVGGNVIKMGDTNLAFKDDWVRVLSNPADLGSFNRGLAAKHLYAHENIYGKKDMAISGTGDIAGIRLSNQWSAYPDEVRGGQWKSEISNDVKDYKSLMIAGNRSSGGARKISMWDDVSVNGDLGVGGKNIKFNDTHIAVANDDWIRLLSNPADLGSFNRGLAAKNLYAQGKIYGAGNRDVIAELDDLKNNVNDLKNNVVRKDRMYAVRNADGRRLQMTDRGEAKAVGNDPWGNWEKMNFVEGS